ncbi:nuclear transport factor 2 family protein [Streptomyces sp. NBC_00059]|uniref:nuclear transport factor 2 family protein n=1 Tax=Streptomyces sp. NBC_00059 TaxID=2975635 RepID=UPI00225C1F28|nr:nuclear transport factor 2 family protein [Streptomyces sp. NBC_00059]MCX5415059.1 nuclear transport factor 2 family protein [Streptomyces sp. NBC_00059]
MSIDETSGPKLPSPELHVEVTQFYARQMHRMDGGDFGGFAASFVQDSVFRPAGGGELRGPEAIERAARGAAGRFGGAQPRHWFDMMTVEEADDGTVSTSYYATVTVASADGSVLVEPTCFVRDTLVRVDGALRSRSRDIERDDLTVRALTEG